MSDFDSLRTSFGSVASEYERGRPTYPPTAVDRAVAELGLDPESSVLDLAAGTGKLTRELAPRFKRVIAVEPLPEMLDVIRRDLPTVEALAGSAAEIPVSDDSVDAVFIGQAFHWFANAEALAEMARVLIPRGGLALVWNTSPWESGLTPWWKRFDELLKSYTEDVRAIRTRTAAEWISAFDDETPFEDLTRHDFAHEQPMTGDEFADAMRSRSYVTALGEGERTALLADIDELLRAEDAPLTTDGRVNLAYSTELYLTRKRL